MVTRPPRRDQPDQAETDRLVADLRARVAATAQMNESTVVRSPDRQQQIRVRTDGAQAHLSLVEHGQVLVEHAMPTADLVAAIERDGQTYATLAGLLPGG